MPLTQMSAANLTTPPADCNYLEQKLKKRLGRSWRVMMALLAGANVAYENAPSRKYGAKRRAMKETRFATLDALSIGSRGRELRPILAGLRRSQAAGKARRRKLDRLACLEGGEISRSIAGLDA